VSTWSELTDQPGIEEGVLNGVTGVEQFFAGRNDHFLRTSIGLHFIRERRENGRLKAIEANFS
jgi:hypothetical protein